MLSKAVGSCLSTQVGRQSGREDKRGFASATTYGYYLASVLAKTQVLRANAIVTRWSSNPAQVHLLSFARQARAGGLKTTLCDPSCTLGTCSLPSTNYTHKPTHPIIPASTTPHALSAQQLSARRPYPLARPAITTATANANATHLAKALPPNLGAKVDR